MYKNFNGSCNYSIGEFKKFTDKSKSNKILESFNYDEKLIVESFFGAGGDLLLDPYNPIECLNVLCSLYENDKITFDDKIKKILKFKEKYKHE